jgi:aspartate racemase
MRTIGLIGGTSWESTVVYYQLLNRRVRAQLGGLHSAKILLHSVDFAPLAEMQKVGDWDAAGEMFAEAARGLERAGADCVLICANTMHLVAEQVRTAVSIPLVHIVPPTAAAIRAQGLTRVALLGTAFTMQKPFLRELFEAEGLEILVPEMADQAEIHRIIYAELCCGEIREQSRQNMLDALARLRAAGAEGAILGCTEISLLIGPQHTDLPLFDTTELHANAAVQFALET